MKVSTTNDNGGNAFARNLMAPILFYPKADSSLGLDNEKSSECNCNVMVHEVCYDPTDADLQMYKIYLNPFDTGSVEQWLKFLTKLNLIITRNGLMTHLAKFNLMPLLLKGEACNISTKKLKSLKMKKITSCGKHQCGIWTHFFPENTLQMQSATCKRSVYTIQ